MGALKGVGRIYQQTFDDTCSKVAFAKLRRNVLPSDQDRHSNSTGPPSAHARSSRACWPSPECCGFGFSAVKDTSAENPDGRINGVGLAAHA